MLRIAHAPAAAFEPIGGHVHFRWLSERTQEVECALRRRWACRPDLDSTVTALAHRQIRVSASWLRADGGRAAVPADLAGMLDEGASLRRNAAAFLLLRSISYSAPPIPNRTVSSAGPIKIVF